MRTIFCSPKKHKKTTTLAIFILVFLIFLSPLFQYIPQAATLGKSFLFENPQTLRGEANRSNFLILGLGGARNEPAGLTDTILFISIDHTKKRHVVISIPRDIWIAEMRAKINTAYHYGNRVDGAGVEWSKKFVQEITGQEIDYTATISFDGFAKVVDSLEGITIDVEREFTDKKYPVPGKENDNCGADASLFCRYETVVFEKGLQKMDGQTALKYVRSRQAESEEGSDFARSKRQQKAIVAIKEAVLSPTFFLNPKKINELLKVVNTSVETDIPQRAYGVLARLLLEGKRENVVSESLKIGDGEPGLLVNPPISEEYDTQWVLVPRTGDWQQVNEWVSCILTGSSCPI